MPLRISRILSGTRWNFGLEGYRDQTLTLYQISEMLGLSRVETEDFLGRHHVPLCEIGEADLDREVAVGIGR